MKNKKEIKPIFKNKDHEKRFYVLSVAARISHTQEVRPLFLQKSFSYFCV